MYQSTNQAGALQFLLRCCSTAPLSLSFRCLNAAKWSETSHFSTVCAVASLLWFCCDNTMRCVLQDEVSNSEEEEEIDEDDELDMDEDEEMNDAEGGSEEDDSEFDADSADEEDE